MEAALKGAQVAADIEVSPRHQPRRFSAEEKRRIIKEAGACTKPGEVGALLRREGIYSSYLTAWRQAQRRAELSGLSPRKRGPVPVPPNPLAPKLAELERENRKLKVRAERAEAVVELQKKIAEFLGIQLPKHDEVP